MDLTNTLKVDVMKLCRVTVLILLAVLPSPFTVSSLFAYRELGHVKQASAEKAPDFMLKDLKGQKFKLSDHKGKPVLLIFGATWCVYCREDIPRLKEIYAEYAVKGLIMANIDVQEHRDKVLRFAVEHRLPYRVLLDETGDVAGIYDIWGVPSMVLIDRRGMIVCRRCFSLEPVLEKMFKERQRKN